MNNDVTKIFDDYPNNVRPKLLELRTLIFQLAADLQLGDVEETLKWGEPSYNVKFGTSIRLDWKLKSPNNYYLFFNCNTKLVDTFKELYGDELVFQGNRAIVLNLLEQLPKQAIEHCIKLGLTYHKVKHLPLLGV